MSRKTIHLPPALERGEEVSPKAVVAWALETFSPRLLMTTSFGLNGMALIHMVHELAPSLPTLFIDTGYHFPETLELKELVVKRYGLNLLEYRIPPSVDEEEIRSGRVLFSENPELCCTTRKVEVFQRALSEIKPEAIISGRSRQQSSTRASLPVVDLEARPMEVNPLAHWSQDEVESFVRENQIPYNPLHDQGYPSIGCWPCTQPVEPGAGFRSGRWSGTEKEECGIWVEGGKVLRASRPQHKS